MNKVTKVNCEGEDYGFVAGGALKGVSGASASEYIKVVVLPEGADLVEGCLLLVTFVNGNTAGFYGTKTIYSSNGTTFYYDQAMTDPVTFPPAGCYTVTHASGNEYLYQAFPVLSVNGVVAPFCDSKGHPYGGAAWSAGDSVTMLYMGDKFVAILSTINQVVAGVDIPPTSDAVYQAIAAEISDRDSAISANNTAKGLVGTKTDNAIARWDGTAGKLQNSSATIDDNGNITANSFIGNASTASSAKLVRPDTTTGTTATDIIYQKMADNDYFRIRTGGTASNAGFVEFATADDKNEPIYVRQYSGAFTDSSPRTATLLDASGNTSFPNNITAGNGLYATYLKDIAFQLSSATSSSAKKWVAVEKWSWGTSSGYIKYTNGLIIQWKKVQATTSGWQTIAFSYPVTDLFTQVPIVAMGLSANGNTDTSNKTYYLLSPTKNGGSINLYGFASNSSAVTIIAIGY